MAPTIKFALNVVNESTPFTMQAQVNKTEVTHANTKSIPVFILLCQFRLSTTVYRSSQTVRPQTYNNRDLVYVLCCIHHRLN